ncbi:putative aminoglycoside phosphotransferase [Saccharomonospora cyanea NA-134]|uniref:Putative aminoglycoside phosphotransferase n=1 Tax=Saccharomonospora cyanea NA-134 TaxID=882082 RepID=H5XQE5_9PSEU|nr:phosphotransferase [Saccharomonospora cyanea]EHR63878.1 putative aminoglycoside phosphotransferase [Saccharomonospora cyanea NA-134]
MAQLRREASLLPWLAPRLPLRIPVPELTGGAAVVSRHELVPGEPLAAFTPTNGRCLGRFLKALHGCSVDDAVRHGLLPASEAALDLADDLTRFRQTVLPLVPAEWESEARAVLDRVHTFPFDTVVHGDLGPEHALTSGDVITGVIDFGDARCGDAAMDFSWTLHGTPEAFADAVAEEYGVTPAQRERAAVWHRLSPWYEVSRGLHVDDPDMVRDGLHGLVSRLRTP